MIHGTLESVKCSLCVCVGVGVDVCININIYLDVKSLFLLFLVQCHNSFEIWVEKDFFF